jgi:hypothetical protein
VLDKANNETVAFIDEDAKAPLNWPPEMARVLADTRERGMEGVGGRISPDYPSEMLEARRTQRASWPRMDGGSTGKKG